MSHKLIYRQEFDEFERETRDSKALLEDLSQQEVLGYRAATYSITRKSLWALDVIAETGFVYDSSIFPITHDRYGIPEADTVPGTIRTPGGATIVEFPISTVKTRFFNIPVAGGGYFRLFPYTLTRMGLRQINKRNQEFMFYLHPWEVDPGQPVIPDISLSTRFRHYVNISRCRQRLNRLFEDFRFTTMRGVLENKGLIAGGNIVVP
jgi:polysaccharide deacetylase family protein (PEP-CTERM system associated)